MLDRWTTDELRAVASLARGTEQHCRRLQRTRQFDDLPQLLQVPRDQRGAWVRPGLAGSAERLQKALRTSYWQLTQDIAASLVGAADDVVSGRLTKAQAKREAGVEAVEETEAARFFGIETLEAAKPLDRSRLAAILILLALWRRQRAALSQDLVAELFAKGHQQAAAEANLSSLTEGVTARQLRGEVVTRFDTDTQRLSDGLDQGSSRSYGLTWIMANAATVGLALVYLRRLFAVEEYRLSMFAEALVWTAWESGYRSGAVEATREVLTGEGAVLLDGTTAADLTEAQLAVAPRFIWSGPLDSHCCPPCLDAFNDGPVLALSIADLVAPEDRCRFGISCRHAYELFTE